MRVNFLYDFYKNLDLTNAQIKITAKNETLNEQYYKTVNVSDFTQDVQNQQIRYYDFDLQDLNKELNFSEDYTYEVEFIKDDKDELY